MLSAYNNDWEGEKNLGERDSEQSIVTAVCSKGATTVLKLGGGPVPSLPFPPSPPLPSPLTSISLPFPPPSLSLPLEVGPLNPARGSGGAL